MNSNIAQNQNTLQQLERLAAQRYMYSTAKRFLTIQLVFDLLSPIILAIVVGFFPWFGIYAALIASLIVVIDFFLEGLEAAIRERAAGVQELFDCELFGLECPELIHRAIPDTVEIIATA